MDSRLFILGIPQLDDEHATLVEILNELSCSLSKCESDRKVAVEDILVRVFEYALMHFNHEEMHMCDNGYHLLYAHKEMHAEISKKLMDVAVNIRDRNVAYQLNLVLVEWLFDHICVHDGAYAKYLLGKMT